MSGIAAIFRLDGRPADAASLDPVLADMADQGPDGCGAQADGPVALGHRLLATTPESLVEPMPFRHAESGCSISADLRLDNRETLLEAFGLNGDGRVIGDGELVLRAWLKWGEACPEKLLGDFAFVLWDPRRRTLFAARDHIGMRPLYYSHREGRAFLCASRVRALLRAQDVPARWHELRLAEFLVDFDGDMPGTTFFEGVHRLPPGYCLRVTPDGLSERRYWRLEPPEPVRLRNDRDYAEALREILTEAVRCRLRSPGPVGSMLSGGMDSGSIVAIASRLLDEAGQGPLRTFSVVGPDPAACVETRGVRKALNLPNLTPTLIDHANLGPLRDRMIALCRDLDNPFDFDLNVARAAYAAASETGIKVLLDGAGGDIALSEANQMALQIRRMQFRRAWREARGIRELWGHEPGLARRDVLKAIRAAATPDLARRLRMSWYRHSLPRFPRSDTLEEAFGRRVGIVEDLQRARLERNSRLLPFAEQRVLAFRTSGISEGRDCFARIGARAGVEARDPFMDLRLIEFTLGLPMEQVQSDGWQKIILRRAADGLLPDDLRWMRGKGHLGWVCTRALLTPTGWWQDLLRAQPVGLGGRVPQTTIARLLDLQGLDDSTHDAAATTVALGLFLGNHAQFDPEISSAMSRETPRK